MAKKIIIIGAGLGGISAAVSLAAEGFSVVIFEKNSNLGGKLNVLKKEGFSFDLGPSILTLPYLFDRLFQRVNRKLADYVPLQPVSPHWRNFFEDGTVIDLFKDDHKMKAELDQLGPGNYAALQKFKSYSKKQYEIIEKGYFNKGLDNPWECLKHYSLLDFLLRLDTLRTMDQGVRRFFKNPYLVDIFNFFIKYIGSSALQAPAFFNLMSHIQFGYDLWYVKGGMYNLALGLKKLMDELGIKTFCNSEVIKITKSGDSVTGVVLRGGHPQQADIIVSNMEVIPAYRRLLGEEPAFLKSLDKFEPACSGLVLHLGVDKVYPSLAHHNFFYSKNQSKHFETVFEKKMLPEDPTIYVVAPTRSDPAQAPEGYDNIKVLPHIPYINEKCPLSKDDYSAFRAKIISKLERMGLDNLRDHIIIEDMWTPLDIEQHYYSHKGAIYGVVSDKKKNFGFKAPKKSSKYANLYFVGGSVNPGGGMPMVILCGQKVCSRIVKDALS